MKSTLRVLLSFVLALGALQAQSGGDRSDVSGARVLRVPVEGQIDRATVRLVQRALEEARSDPSLARVVLDINSPGESDAALDLLENLVSNVQAADQVQVSAYIRNQAFSGGAFLALACDQVYLTRRARIGAITPILANFFGGTDEDADESRRRLIQSFRERVRELIQRRGGASDDLLLVADALVDPNIRLVEITVESSSGLQETKLIEESELSRFDPDTILRQRVLEAPITLTSEEALDYGLAVARYEQLEDLVRDEFGLRSSSIETLEASWSEAFVSWIESFKLLLFLFGFIALLMEAKMPGLIVPGVLGVLAISTALFSSVMLGLADWVEVSFFIVGLGLIAVEIFLIPGTVIAGAAGLLCLVFALILSQQTFFWPSDASQEQTMIANVLDVIWLALGLMVGSVLVFTYLPRIPLLNRLQLRAPEASFATGASGRVADTHGEAAEWVGRTLTTASDLRPAGIAESLEGDRVDVVSNGGFVRSGTRVRVVEVLGNRLMVDEVPSADAPDPEAGAADWGTIAFLMILALTLSIAEVFLVSFGLLGLAATGCAITGIVMAFTGAGQLAGFLLLGGTAIVVPGTTWFVYKRLGDTWLGRMLFLEGPEPGSQTAAAGDPEIDGLVGKRGTATSQLRPSGVARIEGRRVDVTTRGELIEQGVEVEVLRVDSNRVVVRKVAHPERATDPALPTP